MTDGSIVGNSATSGGGICTAGGFSMTGGSVQGNSATYGGGVFMNTTGSFTLSGGRVAENTATNSGNAVYHNGQSLSLSGGVLKGTTHLRSGKAIAVTTGLSTETDITLTTADTPTAAAPVKVAQGSGYTLTAADLTKFTSATDPLYLKDNAIYSHAHSWSTDWTTTDTHHWHNCGSADCPITEDSSKDGYGVHVYDDDQDASCSCGYTRTLTPPHTHAVSVGCETTSGDQVTFDKALTSVDGALYIDGEAAGSYILPPGNYYLADDVTLSDELTLRGASGDQTVNLCLNGHKLALEYTGTYSRNVIYVSTTTYTLNICDCDPNGGPHTITSPVTGEEVTVHGGLITGGKGAGVNHSGSSSATKSLILYGGTIAGNTSTSDGGGVSATNLVMHGGSIVHNQGNNGGGVAATKSAVITGGTIAHNKCTADGGGIYLGNSRLTLTVSGNVVVEDNVKDTAPSNLYLGYYHKIAVAPGGLDENARVGVTTWAKPTGSNFVTVAGAGAGYTLTGDDFAAFSYDQPGYYLTLNSEENAIQLGEIAITTQPTADSPAVGVNYAPEGIAYQWYPVSIVTENVTDQNTTDDRFAGTYADGKWTAVQATTSTRRGYFSIALMKGDVVTVTVEDGSIPSDSNTELCLRERVSWSYNTTTLTADQTVYTLTAPVEGIHDLEFYGSADTALVISAVAKRAKLGAALSGQTAATLNATQSGDYLCRVTWPDGAALSSDIVTVTLPHTHAVSVDCEVDSGTQEIFLPLTVNGEGTLCVDGAALTPNQYGTYTLPAGSYYLPDDITLNSSINIQDAASAPVNFCLNGHTLDLGEGSIRLQSNPKGVLNLCDCGATGKVTSAYSGGSANSATVQANGQLSLYGGTVENTAARDTVGTNKNAVGLNGGTANLYGGKLVSQNGNGLWVSAWQADGLTLSGAVTLQGGTGKADVYFSNPSSTWENNTHFTLTGPLTQPQTPWRVEVEGGKPIPLVSGWSAYMDGKTFSDYFRSGTQGVFVGRQENGDLELARCAITQQPTADNSYTVAANGAPASVPTYQWYPATVTTAEITTENATAYYDSGEEETAAYDPVTKLWSGVGWFDYRYFTISLSKGDVVTVKPDAALPEYTELGLRPEPYDYDDWVHLAEANAAGEYVLTAPAEGDYIFYCQSGRMRSADSDAVPAFSATLTHTALGGALTSQTNPQLNTTGLAGGTYLCRVTWPDGAVLDSDVVTYTPPASHTHPVCGESCGHTGADAHGPVEWLPLTQATLDEADKTFSISGKNYYLAEDITTDKKLTVSGTGGLCFNGHTLTSTYAATDSYIGNMTALCVERSAVFNACDCQGTGGLRTARNGIYLLQGMHDAAVNLYGGLLEHRGSYYSCVDMNVQNGTLTIDGAAVRSVTTAIWLGQGDRLVVKSGSITATGGGAYGVGFYKAHVEVTGGTITGAGSGIGLESANSRVTLSGSPTITGGSYGDIYLSSNVSAGAITVADGLEGNYTVYHKSPVQITEAAPLTLTAAAGADQSDHFSVADSQAGELGIRDVEDENSQHAAELYRKHKWSTVWVQSDDAHHWHNCGNAGCTITDNSQKDGYGEHSFVWKYAESGTWKHWMECTVCGKSKDHSTTHVLVESTTKQPTCTEPGTKEKRCACGYVKTESIPATGRHTLSKTDAVAATCTAYGVREYWSCAVCGKYYADAQGANEITDLDAWKAGDGKVEMTAHVYDDDQDATCNICGYIRPITPPDPDQGNVTGKVEVSGDDTPDVTVDEDALKDLAGEVSDGDTVTVKLTVEKQDFPADKDALEAVISGKKGDVLYLDLSLLKQVNDGTPEAITNTGDKVLEIAVDYDFTGKKDVTVYRKHGDDPAAALTRLTARPTENYTEGSFFADSANGKVYIYAGKFSTYAIGYTVKTTTPSRPSRPSQPAWPFTDVKTTDDCYESVKYVYEKGWMLGTSDTTFDPDGPLTRAMLAAVLYRAAGSPEVEGAPEFEDTQAEAWYSDAIAWAAQTGVLRGYGNGKFGPDDSVSKEMLNMVMGRLQGQDPEWTGDPALALPATRAEIAAMLTQYY